MKESYWKRKVAALSLIVGAGSVGLSGCGNQQFSVHPDLGRVHFVGSDARLQECFSTKPDGGGDVFILDFSLPVRLEQKSPDSNTGVFGDPSKALAGSELDTFIRGVTSGDEGTYYTVDGV